ncbi:hypothetical protein A2303_02910 [Candidatus Falkowbacteria bacterium RIFOXYB2_FULL_47_14]|uniref:Uncharacterized protein n=1 Tax=Candidatus Falkowbacteria bacterium RIFOXYA2_FULL_47_19 TaxID=1797994 RepID=A0A1F5SMC4_9BACT|nr:MAG: hypothetical protein A2227_01985 [Candidatus Falkowbacteria bacterium RIFOXYA2_FULL_47_19]OGF36266.1 MAG: hypothetical protein A2468_07655 [Candidatus Falkowbacteria bacterium RIFOXYC2_FULL_46_15]OGF43070.1 MAG: hypothetical protein A2303_02910 [Candidatus Falkowbacteria bacterium RIFOXYB2_FULL_47_14]
MKRLALIITIIIAIIAPLSPATACDGPNCDTITGASNGTVDTSQWMSLNKEALSDGWKFMADGGQKITGQGHAGYGLSVAGKGELNQAHWMNNQAATPNANVWHMDAADMTLKAGAETGGRCADFKIEAAANRSATTETHAGENSMSAKTGHAVDASFSVKGANPSAAVDIRSQTEYLQIPTKFQGYQTGISEIIIKGNR